MAPDHRLEQWLPVCCNLRLPIGIYALKIFSTTTLMVYLMTLGKLLCTIGIKQGRLCTAQIEWLIWMDTWQRWGVLIGRFRLVEEPLCHRELSASSVQSHLQPLQGHLLVAAQNPLSLPGILGHCPQWILSLTLRVTSGDSVNWDALFCSSSVMVFWCVNLATLLSLVI